MTQGDLIRVLGKSDSGQRFTCLTLFQGIASRTDESVLASVQTVKLQSAIAEQREDPIIVAAAYKQVLELL